MDHLQRIKQEFTRQAAGFATSAALTERAPIQRIIDATGADATKLALDLACGPGIVTAELAAVAREVVAFDLTPEMLAKARERCRKADLDNVIFKEGSATKLPFPEHHFDIVVTRAAVHHFQEPRRILGEAMRVMKKGGVLVVADVVSAELAEKSALQNAIEILRDPSHVRMPPASELASLVRDAGLEIEKQETWDQPRAFEEWAGIVADPERINPVRTIVAALARAGEDAGMGLSAAADGTLAFFHRWLLIAARKP
jgi:ubiquinone/menaquinone biosynthesis C-methylase UbiE